jgi:phosphatidylglycerophosphate synthase
MTASNALTLVRFALCAPTFALSSLGLLPAALGAYLVGILTDAVDGRLARATRTTSSFGAAMDSAADKALTASAMLGLAVLGHLPPVAVFLFFLRECFVFGLRAIRPSDGRPIAEINDFIGRLRFVVLHLGVTLVLAHPLMSAASAESVASLGSALTLIAVAASYISLAFYVARDFERLSRTMRRQDSQ